MITPVVVDANLLLLLVVGLTNRKYISIHKRIVDDYDEDDFEIVEYIVGQFSEIILLPHVITEVANFAKQIKEPARTHIQAKLKSLIETTVELPIPSIYGAHRSEFGKLGLTDSVILHFCEIGLDGIHPTLLTADQTLADTAKSLGYGVVDYNDIKSL